MILSNKMPTWADTKNEQLINHVDNGFLQLDSAKMKEKWHKALYSELITTTDYCASAKHIHLQINLVCIFY